MITELIYPNQDGKPCHVKSKDTLDGIKIHGKTIVGWIYSHVREKSLFIRSLDIHTQHSLQRINTNFFGIIIPENVKLRTKATAWVRNSGARGGKGARGEGGEKRAVHRADRQRCRRAPLSRAARR